MLLCSWLLHFYKVAQKSKIVHGAYYLHSTKLENMNVIKELAVIFDPDLSFVLHCKNKTNLTQCWGS